MHGVLQRSILFLLLVTTTFQLHSQNLNGFIGTSTLPSDADSICPIPLYTGGYSNSGFFEGDTVPDFKFYDLNGDSIVLSEELDNGKPKLIVTGSYTCPVYRNKLPDLQQVSSSYGNDIDIYIIYVVEAHPVIDVSPYSGTVWTTAQNQSDSVLYRQPKTYGERKQIVSEMINDMGITVPIYIDGLCNEWWSNFGPAPNNAYLIDTNGVVFAKHPWFNKSPENIFCDIDSLLGNPLGPTCSGGSTAGTFIFSLNEPQVKSDVPGSTITIYGTLTNTSNEAAVVDIIRVVEDLPNGWTSAMCTDICLPYWVDTTFVQIPAGGTQLYIMYFYTSAQEDTGRVRILFKNRNVSGNNYSQNYMGITDSSLSTGINYVSNSNKISINAIPNPVNSIANFNILNANLLSSDAKICIYDILGNRVKTIACNNLESVQIDVNDLANGMYIYQLHDISGLRISERLIVKH
ncbi:MAG: T9SS type A sorting domain-containing protein [Bacteroidia bacterium]|nr:T9SS type A sorting domain-containing protein [Bacteroidia bacterium]